MSGKHIDFTQLQIVGIEGLVEVERIEPWFVGDHVCESCMAPDAEYLITAKWDWRGKYTIAYCQICFVHDYNDPTHPDTYNFVA